MGTQNASVLQISAPSVAAPPGQQAQLYVYPTHESLLDENVRPAAPEQGRTLQPSSIFPPEGKLGCDMIYAGAVRWALQCEGVLVRFSRPGNTETLEPSDIQASLMCVAEAKGYSRTAVDSQLPVGNRFGPWEQTMAAQLADELVLDDVLSIFRLEDDAPTVDLEVSILTPMGTKYAENGKPRGFDPEKAKIREERNQRRTVMYVEYPKLNMEAPEKLALLKQLKDKITQHLVITHDAEEVGFTDSFDKRDHAVCKFVMFVHHKKEVEWPIFMSRALPGIKFISMGVHRLAKIKIPGHTLQKLALRPCCFLSKCIPKPGAETCGANDRAYQATRANMGARVQRESRELKRKAQKAEGDDQMERIAKKHTATVIECRAFTIGRCRKENNCTAKHISEPKSFNCSSTKFGTLKFKKKLDTCPYTLETCPYSNHVDKTEMEVLDYPEAEGAGGAEGAEPAEEMEDVPPLEKSTP